MDVMFTISNSISVSRFDHNSHNTIDSRYSEYNNYFTVKGVSLTRSGNVWMSIIRVCVHYKQGIQSGVTIICM